VIGKKHIQQVSVTGFRKRPAHPNAAELALALNKNEATNENNTISFLIVEIPQSQIHYLFALPLMVKRVFRSVLLTYHADRRTILHLSLP